MNSKEMSYSLALKVAEKGGRAYYVGGYVRDLLMGKESKDIDIEVHGLNREILEEIIDSLGNMLEAGKSFGIYGIKGCEIDIAMARREKKKGEGHKAFEVDTNADISLEDATKRRDFTVNAIMQDILTGELIDFFDGTGDIERKVIRHVNDESFAEDPLRVLRAAQFSARFGFSIEKRTKDICSEIDLSFLSKERVLEELKKALLKSDRPSVFFNTLREMNQLDTWFKEVKNLIGVKQNPYHHSEGDVWNHTMMVLDEGVKYREKAENPLGFMLACLVHDFGKAICTEVIDGKIKSHGHDKKGLPIAEEFLKKITSERKLIKYVLNLAELHMKPNMLAFEGAGIKKTNRMFDKAIDEEALLYIAMADSRGKIGQYEYISYDDFLFERLKIYREYMARPYVAGKDLIKQGINPGPDFKEALEYAHKLRLAGIEKESALKQTLAYVKGIKN